MIAFNAHKVNNLKYSIWIDIYILSEIASADSYQAVLIIPLASCRLAQHLLGDLPASGNMAAKMIAVAVMLKARTEKIT